MEAPAGLGACVEVSNPFSQSVPLRRMFTIALLTCVEYNSSSIPIELAAPKSATGFRKGPLPGRFNEGCRLSMDGRAWRKTPPGIEPEESARECSGNCLNYNRLRMSRLKRRRAAELSPWNSGGPSS